ncbi:DUF7344 domain-containing protein [Natrinema versiforme]|uniref:DUF7344 domain-containing protein n=1 Tax=Natrinema versiforme JCM 10478 TaxID=1227496 RepID=L9XT59_9EURY|nr:hypothetical protein [Natrinema versiforme]ELY64556.1 hypothetical protein C489_17424 [Natrinema versiforme JCM 10478]
MIPLLGSPESLTAFGEDADAVDTAMDLLADKRRRAALQYLAETGGDATLTELAVEIAAQEASADPNAISDHGDVSSRDRRTVQVSLHHTHIPKLQHAEVVEYDTETETIELTDRGRTLLERREAIEGPSG